MSIYGTHYIPGKWCVTPYTFAEEVRKQFRLPKHFHVRDNTLREGEKQPFCNALHPPANRLKVAQKLYELGVREAELGFPGTLPEDFETIRLVKREIPEMKVTAIARIGSPEWRQEIDRCAEAGADFIDILNFGPTLHLHLYGGSKTDIITRDVEGLEYARTTGKAVGFAPNDALRTEWSWLEERLTTALRIGIDRFTVYEDGYGAPSAIRYLVGKVKDVVGDLPVVFHSHNDTGLSTASTVAAVEGGAEVADLVMNGMGGMGGTAALEEVVVCLEIFYGIKTGIVLEKLYETSLFLQEFTGVKLQPHKPVVGRNMFVQENDFHVNRILRGLKWETEESYAAELVGQRRRVVFGQATLGGQAVRARLENLGITCADADVERVIGELRRELEHKDFLELEEFDELALRVLR